MLIRHDNRASFFESTSRSLCLVRRGYGPSRSRGHGPSRSRGHGPSRLRRITTFGAVALGVLIARTTDASPLRIPSTFSFDAFDRDRDANPVEKNASTTDGVYGRFNGELSLEPFVGAAWTHAGMLTEFGVSGYYFHTVGLQAKYGDGRLFPSSDEPYSITTLSLALRPLFLFRWKRDLEQGPSWFDLTIDSLTLKVGGFWAAKTGSDNTDKDVRGLETELSFGVPLLARYSGPWLSAAIAHRYRSVTDDGHDVDLAASLRLEWAFSLGQ